MLLIDTEGHDHVILQNIDFNKIHPKLIYFEHCHLAKEDYKAVLKLLRMQGYSLYSHKFNTIAFIDSALTKIYH